MRYTITFLSCLILPFFAYAQNEEDHFQLISEIGFNTYHIDDCLCEFEPTQWSISPWSVGPSLGIYTQLMKRLSIRSTLSAFLNTSINTGINTHMYPTTTYSEGIQKFKNYSAELSVGFPLGRKNFKYVPNVEMAAIRRNKYYSERKESTYFETMTPVYYLITPPDYFSIVYNNAKTHRISYAIGIGIDTYVALGNRWLVSLSIHKVVPVSNWRSSGDFVPTILRCRVGIAYTFVE